MARELIAIVFAETALAELRIAGLSARERAIRIAGRVGASRVHLVGPGESERAAAFGELPADALVLAIDANQLVHTPLVAPLLARRDELPADGLAVAVGPDDVFAGACLATGRCARELVAARDHAWMATQPPTFAVRHGEIARHAIATPAERRAAHRMLYRILIKPQDNAITRYLYRPISFPLTRVLAWTPITPNQISYLVGVLVAIGCFLTAHRSMGMAIAGTATILAASYLDCCDGEIARIKLLSSKYGAWIDTVIDELSTIGYMVALGYHCHLAFGPGYLGALGWFGGRGPWLITAAACAVLYVWSMYIIYYNIIVAVGSANSQDYVGRFEVVPGAEPNTVRLRPASEVRPARQLPPGLHHAALYLSFMVRRDFIAWCAMGLALAHLTQVSFAIQVLGGVMIAPVLTLDHLRLRRQRRSIARAGQTVVA
ncbi:MAG: CDP-alcohol phosphatidyltransferase family protein [Proteobacteria bacterium]|nr:CDP-alcohol phosphatidyltransferase family protein [Pseudomonadota bacterium]